MYFFETLVRGFRNYKGHQQVGSFGLLIVMGGFNKTYDSAFMRLLSFTALHDFRIAKPCRCCPFLNWALVPRQSELYKLG